MWSQAEHPPIVVTHEDGVRFVAQIREHRLVVDQPADNGGEDAGPSPTELLGASLGTCVAYYVQQFCQARKIPYEGLRIEVDQHKAKAPSRIGQFDVRVMMPTELPEPYGEKLEIAVRSCPVHNTLTHGTDVEFMIAGSVALP